LSTPRRTLHEDYVAFTAPWPAALLRLQRRESYRLPLSATATATLLPGADADGRTLRGLDLSAGGLALAVPDGAIHRFPPRRRLQLGDAEPVPVAVEVAWTARDGVRGNTAWWRAGCRFAELPAALEQQLMQYIFRIERQRNARLRRGG